MNATITDNSFAHQSFSSFYRYMMEPSDTTLDVLSRSSMVAENAREVVRRQLDTALSRKLETESFRVLISEFHAQRQRWGLPSDVQSSGALRKFSVLLAAQQTGLDILARHPVLAQNLKVVRDNFVRSVEELVARYKTDMTALRNEGWIAFDDQIIGITVTGSDSHNGGRQVFIVALKSGAKIVYKPRPLAIDRFVKAVFARVSEALDVSLDKCVPNVLDRGEHGWQEFIEADRSVTAEGAERYFYRFGVATMVLGAIGAGDMHHENVVARGEYPCFVDVETALRPDIGDPYESLAHLLLSRLNQGPTSTMLLPVRVPNGPYDVLLAGIGVPREQVSKREAFQILNRGSDAVSVSRQTYSYKHSDNLVRIGSTVVDPLDHFVAIRRGYRACFRSFQSGQVDVDGVFESYAAFPVRYLVRATAVYSQFIDAATHPDYLRSRAEYDRLLSLLAAPTGYNELARKFIAANESADMGGRDVPYFSVDAGSRNLGTLKAVGPEVFDRSPRENCLDSMAAIRDMSVLSHEFVLEESLNELVVEGESSPLWEFGLFKSTLSSGPSPQTGLAVAEVFSGLAHQYEGPDGPRAGWVFGGGAGPSSATLSAGTLVAFHDGGGIPVFLNRVAGFDESTVRFAEAAGRGHGELVEQYRGVLVPCPESVFSGQASALFSAVPLTDRRFDELIGTIWDRFEAGTADTDVAGGVAGVVLMLAGPLTDRRWLRGRAAELVAEAPGRLWRSIGDPTRAWFDVAHGRIGIAWAVARAAHSTGNERLLSEVAEWVVSQLAVTSDFNGRTAWCSGAAGVCLVVGEVLALANRTSEVAADLMPELLDRATKLPGAGPVDLSVCHGGSGVEQGLLALQLWLPSEQLVARAVEYRDQLYAHAAKYGYFTGTPSKTSTLGYMLGWAGIGDTDVLLGRAHSGESNHLIPVALNGIRG